MRETAVSLPATRRGLWGGGGVTCGWRPPGLGWGLGRVQSAWVRSTGRDGGTAVTACSAGYLLAVNGKGHCGQECFKFFNTCHLLNYPIILQLLTESVAYDHTNCITNDIIRLSIY